MFFSHGAMIDHHPIWLGRFSIITIIFANTEHIDKSDLIKGALTLFQDEFRTLLKDYSMTAQLREEVKVAQEYVEEFGISIPTPCAY